MVLLFAFPFIIPCSDACDIISVHQSHSVELIKTTYESDNNIWLKPTPSFKWVNFTLFDQPLQLVNNEFEVDKWNPLATTMIYSNNIHKCSLSVIINDVEPHTRVVRCPSGIFSILEDSVLKVFILGEADLSFNCDPNLASPTNDDDLEVGLNPSEVTGLVIVIGLIFLALIYHQVIMYL